VLHQRLAAKQLQAFVYAAHARTFAASQYAAGDLVFSRRVKRSGQHGQPPM